MVNDRPNWDDTVLHKPLPLHCYSVLCFLCELWISVLLYTPTQQFINFRISRPALVGSTFCSPGVEVVVGPHAREITWNPSYKSVTSDFTHLLIILRNLEHSCMDRWTVFPVTQKSYVQGRKWLVLFEDHKHLLVIIWVFRFFGRENFDLRNQGLFETSFCLVVLRYFFIVKVSAKFMCFVCLNHYRNS